MTQNIFCTKLNQIAPAEITYDKNGDVLATWFEGEGENAVPIHSIKFVASSTDELRAKIAAFNEQHQPIVTAEEVEAGNQALQDMIDAL
jgi:hypothetical protein